MSENGVLQITNVVCRKTQFHFAANCVRVLRQTINLFSDKVQRIVM